MASGSRRNGRDDSLFDKTAAVRSMSTGQNVIGFDRTVNVTKKKKFPAKRHAYKTTILYN